MDRGEEAVFYEVAGEAQACLDIAGEDFGAAVDQECGQGKQAVYILLRLGAAHGAACARGDMGEPVIGAADGAFVEVEPETQRGKQAKLPAHIERGPDFRMGELVEQQGGGVIEAGAGRVALIETAAQEGCDGGQRREGGRIVQQVGGAVLAGFGNIETAKMVVQPAGPAQRERVAGLELGTLAAGGAAIDKAGAAAALMGQHIEDEAAFPEAAPAEHYSVIGPVHRAPDTPLVPGFQEWRKASPLRPSGTSPAGGGGEKPVRLISTPSTISPDISILVSRQRIPWSGHSGRFAVGEVYEAIRDAQMTLVFVNTRSQAELLFQELWAANEDGLPIALHHGSLARDQRARVEAAMAAGQLKAVVCTSTLDLGIDWGEVDLVIQMGAPKGAARLIQRIGRSNHRMDEASKALLVPTNRFEVLECRAAEAAVEAGEIDGDGPRTGALDILAQHVMGRACGEGFQLAALYDEIRRAQPYRDLDWETYERIVDFVATGGYALKTYDRFHRIVRRSDGLWVARTPRDKQAHRMNVGAIVEAPMLSVRLASFAGRGTAQPSPPPPAGEVPRRGGGGQPSSAASRFATPTSKAQAQARSAAGGATAPSNKIIRAGRKLGDMEEYFLSLLTPGDTFLFGGEVLRLITIDGMDALCTRAESDSPAIPTYNGGKFPLSTFLADRVRHMIHNRDDWKGLPDPVREWFEIQELRSTIPPPDHLLVETFPRADRHYLVSYPFEGRLAHQTLGMLVTRRLERAGARPVGFVASEYAMAVWGMEDMRGLDMEAIFHPDMLGDDLEEWLDESALMKRTFGHCAQISGLIHRNLPGSEKNSRQVSFSTDLIFDVLRSHEPGHILLQATRADAATGLLDVRRLSAMLARIHGHIVHQRLDRISPFAVPVMLEVGREPVFGASAMEAILREAEEDLVRDAMG